MHEAMTVHEKIASAARSSHLQHQPFTCAIDKMGALGMAGVSNNLSSAVRLKYGNEPRFYPDALAAVGKECKRLMIRERWEGGSTEQYADMSRAALDYWLNDRCSACDGLGYEKIAGAPMLSDNACPKCKGTAKRSVPRQRNAQWTARFFMLLAKVEELEAAAGAAVMRRLSVRMGEFDGVS